MARDLPASACLGFRVHAGSWLKLNHGDKRAMVVLPGIVAAIALRRDAVSESLRVARPPASHSECVIHGVNDYHSCREYVNKRPKLTFSRWQCTSTGKRQATSARQGRCRFCCQLVLGFRALGCIAVLEIRWECIDLVGACSSVHFGASSRFTS